MNCNVKQQQCVRNIFLNELNQDCFISSLANEEATFNKKKKSTSFQPRLVSVLDNTKKTQEPMVKLKSRIKCNSIPKCYRNPKRIRNKNFPYKRVRYQRSNSRGKTLNIHLECPIYDE